MMGVEGGTGGSSLVGEINSPRRCPRAPRSILSPSLPGNLPLFPLKGMGGNDRTALGTALKIRKKCPFAYLTRDRSPLTPRVLTQTLRDRVSRKRPFNGRLTGTQGSQHDRGFLPLTPHPAARGFTDGGLYGR
jgi:hypothetical protein